MFPETQAYSGNRFPASFSTEKQAGNRPLKRREAPVYDVNRA